MTERPDLSAKLDAATFRSYYYLKEELVSFCRENGLPASGGKEEITERIACYLDTGRINPVKKVSKSRKEVGVITEQTIIEPDFVCSEKHRAFFKEKIGNSFSFPVAFQKWLKTNSGKTYAQAIEAYYQILEEKKKGRLLTGSLSIIPISGIFSRRIPARPCSRRLPAGNIKKPCLGITAMKMRI